MTKEAKKQKIEKIIDKSVKKAFEDAESEKKSYFQSIGIFVFSLLIFVSCGYFAYKAYFAYLPPTEFIVLDQEYRVLEESPLTEEIADKEMFTNTINQWLFDIFDYHYLNLDVHGQKIRKYFATDSAYADFMTTFNGLRLQDRVRALRAIVRPTVVEPLHIVDSDIYGGVQRFYQLNGVFVVEIIGDKGKEVVRYNVVLIVARRSLLENEFGYAIEVIALRG